MSRRLNHERELVRGEYNEDHTQLTVNNIVFKLPKHFPFSPPYLYVDSNESVYYLTKWYRIFSPIIRKYNVDIECFCCSTMACMWSPCNTCKQLYDEYIAYRRKLILCAQLSCLSKLPFDDNVGSIIATFLS